MKLYKSIRPLAALFYFMLGYTIGGLQFGGLAKDVAWGGVITIGLGAARFIAGYLVLNPVNQELSKTSTSRRLYKWCRRKINQVARKVRRLAHYLDGHEGKSYKCKPCKTA